MPAVTESPNTRDPRGKQPLNTALEELRNHPSPREALELATRLWNTSSGTVTHELTRVETLLLQDSMFNRFKNHGIYRFDTRGCPDNERIITALRDNSLTWRLAWELSTAGGVHIFAYPHEPA